MLNRAIIAAFLATTAVAFGVEAALAAEGVQCEASQPAPEGSKGRPGRPLGTVDTSPREGCATPRTVRA
jgi:hypothetical protein